MKLREKTTATLLITIFMISMMAFSVSVMAKKEQETIQVWWLEDATRHHGDGTFHTNWINDPIPPTGSIGYIEFRITGKSYHADMELFYNQPLTSFEASPFIIANGKFATWARYTSPRSGLPILDKLRGELTIDEDAGTAYGSYVQYSYAFGAAEDVLHWYPHAKVSPRAKGMWLLGITEYTVHGQTPTT